VPAAPAARLNEGANAVGPPASHSQGLAALRRVVDERGRFLLGQDARNVGCEESLPDTRNVRLDRGFQFALYRLLATCHAARRDCNDDRTLWATALESNAEQRLIQPAEIRPWAGSPILVPTSR
jgi:hypothetical protein